jgi:hypothetical protein
MSRPVDPRNIEVIDDQMAAILRDKSVTGRIAMSADANDTARLLAAAGIRHVHPDWSEDQVQQEVARRMLGATD